MLGLITHIGIWIASYFAQLGYPIYKTYNCINEGKFERQWLAYWVIYSVFLLLEVVFGSLDCCCTGLVIKGLISLWLVHPDYLGASYLHAKFIDGAFSQVEPVLGQHLRPILGLAKKDKSE